MSLYEKKTSHWKLIFSLILLAVIIVFVGCDFMPKQETVEKIIVHTAD